MKTSLSYMKLDVNDIRGYELVHQETLEDIGACGYLLRHLKTGAVIAGILNDDDNKVFTIGFRTPPKNSTGVAHILEHAVLCGSKDFPIKDPFIELEKGSLKTFLNAMTYPDRTIYPVASYNDKDFRNLVHVYMDAVFFPLIYQKEEIFRQEGWSFELDSLEDKLRYNGVVFNEMKGALSSPEAQLERGILSSLYPDTCYAYEYGGDPREIPDLTYEEFLDFHRTYYHPSNAWIYLYGDLDLNEQLQWMDEHYLSKFEEKKIHSSIPIQKAFTKVNIARIPYGITEDDQTEKKTYLSFNWSIEDNQEVDLMFAFDILLEVLVNSNASILRKKLMESGLGSEVSGRFESFLFQPFLGITLRESEEAYIDQVEQIIRETLEEIVRDGIDLSLVESVLSLHEFQYKEAEYWNNLTGLFYGLSCFDTWIYHKGNPFANLHKQAIIDDLKVKIYEGYLEKLIQTYLLDNKHLAKVILYPQKGLSKQLEEAEKEKLVQKEESLSLEEKQKIIEGTHRLKAYKESQTPIEDMEKLPVLSLSDISKEAKQMEVKEILPNKGRILYEDMATKGISYLSLLYDVSFLKKEELPYLGLLQYLLGSIDTQNYDIKDLEIFINQHTGGIHHSLLSGNGHHGEFYFLKFDIKCLDTKLDKAWSLFEEVMEKTSFDNEAKLLEIISMMKIYHQEKLVSSGHMAAVTEAFAYDDLGGFKQACEGLDFYRHLSELSENFEAKKTYLKDKLGELLRKINHRIPVLNIIGKKKTVEVLQPIYETFVKDKEAVKSEKGFSFEESVNLGVQTSSQVQYVAKVGNYTEGGLAYHGSLRVLTTILGTEYLWNQVRILGGAYGCMAGFGRFGKSYFVSYRDPHLKRTLEIYEEAIHWIENFDVSERDLRKFIIGTISQMDMPLSNRSLGGVYLLNYLCGISWEERSKERAEVLETSVEDIRRTSAYIKCILEQNHLCVFGREDKIKENEHLFDRILSINERKKD